MEANRSKSLEKALAKTDADADAALRAATTAVRSLKRFRAAAHTGDLRELGRTIEAADQAITALRQQFVNAKEGWAFDEESYLSGTDFMSEILRTAESEGLKIVEQDGRLFCSPFLIRVLPAERAVMIDKSRERRIRPSVLVSHLKDLQNKPERNHQAFLEALFDAYSRSAPVLKRENDLAETTRIVVALLDIYELLTLLPGLTKEYPRQEFARDIYLLDKSRTVKTKKGFLIRFHGATGTKTASRTITVITENGNPKPYYGISFAIE